ncbi:MAG: transcriptional regulator [Gammaproteobacteria bacterium]|jgi:transcriptional regulator with XRE-family HTH domain|nr:transcriptional regulator [Gammaproteobacteria bacterium]MBT3722953.1 transcriptional regulator [Gammaproteobacteria bacterium]MBT4077414.1 transcriptional regulator [Gammaproteobacteria bacterium]MBT4193389.1 transcriptional regulator [Gammaproteobacteria bacterium]MBT4449070.1 transcriptional regulator [Gammaproteobacteria bacterium]
MDPFIEQIGSKLKLERKARQQNQTDAALISGLSRREISEIENGIFRGSILKVQDYAMSLGFSLMLEMKRRPTLAELPGLFDED